MDNTVTVQHIALNIKVLHLIIFIDFTIFKLLTASTFNHNYITISYSNTKEKQMKKIEIDLEDIDFEKLEHRANDEDLSMNEYIMKRVYMNYNSDEAVSKIDALIDTALADSDDSIATMTKIKLLVEAAADLLEEDDYGDGEDYDDD